MKDFLEVVGFVLAVTFIAGGIQVGDTVYGLNACGSKPVQIMRPAKPAGATKP